MKPEQAPGDPRTAGKAAAPPGYGGASNVPRAYGIPSGWFLALPNTEAVTMAGTLGQAPTSGDMRVNQSIPICTRIWAL